MTVNTVETITITEPDGTTVSVSGERGPQGPTGATGATGVVAATAPATYNSGTQTVGVTLGTTANTAAEGNHTHSGMVTSSEITTIVALTQAEYDALGTPSATALYFING